MSKTITLGDLFRSVRTGEISSETMNMILNHDGERNWDMGGFAVERPKHASPSKRPALTDVPMNKASDTEVGGW